MNDTVTLYRVETPDGRGPYTSFMFDDEQYEASRQMGNRHSADWSFATSNLPYEERASCHPGPSEDPGLRVAWRRREGVNSVDLRFAFQSIVEAEEDLVSVGEYQAVYDHRYADVVDTLGLAEVLL